MLRAVSRVPVIVATARDDEARDRPARWTRAPTTTWSSRSAPASSTPGSAPCCAAAGGGADGRGDAAVDVGGLRIDPRSRPATLDGAPLELTPREFDLLALPGRARRAGGQQAGAADRGVAAAVRRRGQDRRRAPVVAAPQARGDRAASPATCTRSAASASGWTRRPRAVRRADCALLVAATMSLVLLAFLVPLALLVRGVAADRAVSPRPPTQAQSLGRARRHRRPAVAAPRRRPGQRRRRPAGHRVPAGRHRRSAPRRPPDPGGGARRPEHGPSVDAGAAGRSSSSCSGLPGGHRGHPRCSSPRRSCRGRGPGVAGPGAARRRAAGRGPAGRGPARRVVGAPGP